MDYGSYGVDRTLDRTGEWILAGDSLANHKGQQFTTIDMDNDNNPDSNCAVSGGADVRTMSGGWWYNICGQCNPNGLNKGPDANNNNGIVWKAFKGWSSLKMVHLSLDPMETNEACECNVEGSDNPDTCDDNGKCTCKPNIGGDKCDQCNEGFVGFPNCQEGMIRNFHSKLIIAGKH